MVEGKSNEQWSNHSSYNELQLSLAESKHAFHALQKQWSAMAVNKMAVAYTSSDFSYGFFGTGDESAIYELQWRNINLPGPEEGDEFRLAKTVIIDRVENLCRRIWQLIVTQKENYDGRIVFYAPDSDLLHDDFLAKTLGRSG